jgi:phenylacetate-CoA ligase
MYHKKYKNLGIYPNDIKELKDINKLPIISKEDIKNYFPDGIIPKNKDVDKLIKVSTSGTTGKSLSIYVDMYDIIIGLFGYLRIVKDYGLNWRKHKLSIIGDFAPHTAETGYIRKGLLKKTWINSMLNNIQWLDTNDSPEMIINDLSYFQPDFIGGYTGMLGHLAVLKQNGLGKNITPKYIASTGSVLNPSLKMFIESAFNTHVFEVYGATETGPIAFQCKEKGKYHVMSDLLHLEYFEDDTFITSEKPGHLIVTKLYAGGTPIIRYNAINDIVSPLYEKHDCGLSGELIDKIYGRDSIRLYRKDGRILLASSLTGVFNKILYDLQTSKVRDIKVIQHNIDKIEIQVVIDKILREKGPSIDEIFLVLKNGFIDIFGSDTEILIKEVKDVSKKEPRIISKVDLNNFNITGYA